MDNEKISPIASSIIQGLQEAIADANGERLCQRFCVNSKPPKNANF